MRCSITTWVGDAVEADRLRDKRVYVPPACRAIDVAEDIRDRAHRAHFAAAWRRAFGIGVAEYRQLCLPITVLALDGGARKIRTPTNRAVPKCGHAIAQKVVCALSKARVTRGAKGSRKGKAEEDVADSATRRPEAADKAGGSGEQESHLKKRAEAEPAKRMRKGGKVVEKSGLGKKHRHGGLDLRD